MLDLGECKVSIVCMSHSYQPFVSGHRYGKFKHAGRLAPFFYKCWPVRRSKCACRPAVVLKCAGRLALHRLAPILSWSSVWDHAGRLALPTYVRPALSVEMWEATCGSFQICDPACIQNLRPRCMCAPACARYLAHRLASAGFRPILDNIGRKPCSPGGLAHRITSFPNSSISFPNRHV